MTEAPETVNTVRVIDDSWSINSAPHPYASLVQTFRVHDAFTVRVRLKADYYTNQSYAIAEVLTPALTWTDIVSEPATEWRGTINITSEGARSIAETIAEKLVQRAAGILFHV